MEMTLMILSAIAAPMVFMLLTYWMDRRQPEPAAQLAKGFSLGGVVALLSLSFTAILNESEWINVSDITSWNHFKQAFLGASLPEELSKLTVLWILLKNNKYFDEFLDGIVYAVFIAMGFASVENICYLLTNPAQWEAVIAGRSLLSVPAHFCYAVIAGAFYSFWHFRREKTFLCYAMTVPVLMHGVFDYCLNEITPESSTASLIGIAVVFVILLLMMGCFVYWGITSTKNIDVLFNNAIMQKRWKLAAVRNYAVAGLMLSSTLLLNGEPAPSAGKTIEYTLSKELADFRDSFCLKARDAYGKYFENGDAKALRMELLKSLGHYNSSNYSSNKEFAMKNYTVKIADFEELRVLPLGGVREGSQDDDAFVPFDEHFCYNPFMVRTLSEQLYKMPVHDSGMMYELIHTINKWTTDGSAATARMPLCKCLHRTLAGSSDVTLTFECFGKQELLLVSEHGGSLQMTVTDKTRNKTYPSQQTDGASWLTWTMTTQGECEIHIINPTDEDLSFVLATTQKQK